MDFRKFSQKKFSRKLKQTYPTPRPWVTRTDALRNGAGMLPGPMQETARAGHRGPSLRAGEALEEPAAAHRAAGWARLRRAGEKGRGVPLSVASEPWAPGKAPRRSGSGLAPWAAIDQPRLSSLTASPVEE